MIGTKVITIVFTVFFIGLAAFRIIYRHYFWNGKFSPKSPKMNMEKFFKWTWIRMVLWVIGLIIMVLWLAVPVWEKG